MNNPLISILVCSLKPPLRDEYYINRLLDLLQPQLNDKIELLIESDLGEMRVGEKRNVLMNKAKGKFIIFVDDDDRVSDDYVEKLLKYTEYDVDCVTIGVEYTQNGSNKKIYDFDFHKNINFRDKRGAIAGRMPNHICLWKKVVAKREPFINVDLGEDHNWAERQILKGYSVIHTTPIIYFYDFDRTNTQTRFRR